jgi:hypothetical protein
MLTAGCSPNREGNSLPGIIYILADDLGYGDMGCYGQTRIETHRDKPFFLEWATTVPHAASLNPRFKLEALGDK